MSLLKSAEFLFDAQRILVKWSLSWWLCLHENESRSERRFGSRSKTWLGSWFELRAFTCIANAFPITIRILRTARYYFAPTAQSARADWPMRLCICMASARIFKMHTHESRSERALRSHVLESGFLGGSRSKTPFFRVSKAWFETALRSQGLKSGFQIRKGPNHVPKRLSERDSFSCKQAHWLLFCCNLALYSLSHARWNPTTCPSFPTYQH